jgi:DNA-binding IclR family transcriptional regulator
VKLIRKHGYSYDDEEHALGLRCVAAAVYDEHSEPMGAISLAGPLSRLTDERIPRARSARCAHRRRDHRAHGRQWPHPY